MIDQHTMRAYCFQKPGATEDLPFGPETLTFKVMGKIFALIPLDLENEAPRVSVKCQPDLAEMLRDIYDAVQPGYHMNKRHWNTVIVDGSIPDDEIYEMIDRSYDLVVKGLKKTEREQLKRLTEMDS